MKILILEPFYTGSHRQWAIGLQKHSSHRIEIWNLPGRHWKWRMHGAALTFGERWKREKPACDLIITTDLLDLATFKGVSAAIVPIIHYYHENQLAYPWSKQDDDPKRNWDRRYVWINFTSAMAADEIWFNSEYNRSSFLDNLPEFLKVFPDAINFNIDQLWAKSRVMPLGLELPEKVSAKKVTSPPVILWNHRWEYDKQPELFFSILAKIKAQGIEFNLVILGTHTHKYPVIFDEVKEIFKDQILQFGPVASQEEYWNWLSKCTYLPVTNQQDFFGISVVEAIAAGCIPLLPEGLAYEEHVNPEQFPELFYHNEKELLDKLLYLLQSEPSPNLEASISNYQWNKKSKEYDAMFKEVLHKFI